MNQSLGRVAVELADPVTEIRPELVGMINENVNPPVPVTADDVHVRAMFVVSNEVNSYGGRFPDDELPRLAELMVDSPVLVGHRKDRLPIARNFHARIVKRDGRPWIKSYFYWLRRADRAESLLKNIDGGVFKECSLGFTFSFPECSICGKDIRECRHEPSTAPAGSRSGAECHFNYRRLERVLETSLVYRGAVPGTGLTADLAEPERAPWVAEMAATEIHEIESQDEIDAGGKLLVTPAYEGMLVVLKPSGRETVLTTPSNQLLPPQVNCRLGLDEVRLENPVAGILMACRGRERLARRHLIDLLNACETSPHRLELKLFPSDSVPAGLLDKAGRDRVCPMRYRRVESADLADVAAALQTRQGVHIWTDPEQVWRGERYLYHPDTDGADSFRLQIVGSDSARLTVNVGGERTIYRLFQFNLNRLQHGGRFVCDPVPQAPPAKAGNGVKGAVDHIRRFSDGCLLLLSGGLRGEYALQKIRLEGRSRLMFYKVGEGPATRS